MNFAYTKVGPKTTVSEDKKLRNVLISKLKRTERYKAHTITSLTRLEDSQITPSIYCDVYDHAQLWSETDYIVNDDLTESPTPEEDRQALSTICRIYSSYVTHYPWYDLYGEYLEHLNDHLTMMSILDKGEDSTTEQSIKGIMACGIDYVAALVKRFDEIDYESTLNQDVWTPMKGKVWEAEENKSMPTDTPEQNKASNQVGRLNGLLISPDLSDEVVSFILTPTIGNCPVGYISKLQSPIFATTYPIVYLTNPALAIWAQRLNVFNYVALNNVLDDMNSEEQTHLAVEAAKHINIDSFRKFYNVQLKFTLPQDDENDGTDSTYGLGFGNPYTPRHGKGKKKTQKDQSKSNKDDDQSIPNSRNNQPPPQQQQQQQQQQQPPPSTSTIPDDTNYVPDLWLANYAKSMTKHAKANPNDMTHDHMTRFGTTNEGATTVSKSLRRKGDYTVQIRDVNGIRDYLVTYTRLNKKPIFSPMV